MNGSCSTAICRLRSWLNWLRPPPPIPGRSRARPSQSQAIHCAVERHGCQKLGWSAAVKPHSRAPARDWEAKLTPALGENLRRRRKGKVGRSWYVDETYIRVRGGWRYLYRAIDRAGALVDVMLNEHRDLAAAKAFFRSAKAVTGVTPDRVTTDGHDAYPRATRTELGRHVRHRT